MAMPGPVRIQSTLLALSALAFTGACSHASPRSTGSEETSTTGRVESPATSAAPVTAARTAESEEPSSPYTLLAGDFHCHVHPPDSPSDVARGVAETAELAARENLDFVVLTPHVPARFFQVPKQRRDVLLGQKNLRAALGAHASGKTIFIPGVEYTDHVFGHAGVAFGDMEAVLGDLDTAALRAHPERFFERYVQRGGVLVVNHPFCTPLESEIAIARADLSFRPFTTSRPAPAEIQALARLSLGYEAYNYAVTELRDRFLLGDADHSIRRIMARMDGDSVGGGRRLVPVGGSDSHAHYLKASTFVWSERPTQEGIRDALVAGRVCVRGREACSLAVRGEGQNPWVLVGGAVRGAAIEARVREGSDIEIFVDGVTVARPAAGEITHLALPNEKCSVIRARVGEGYSGAVYANCDFARPTL
jgi:hypothetical protein